MRVRIVGIDWAVEMTCSSMAEAEKTVKAQGYDGILSIYELNPNTGEIIPKDRIKNEHLPEM